MKLRQFGVLLVAVMALAACGADEPAASDTAGAAASEPAAVESEPAAIASEASSEASSEPAAGGGAATIAVESSDLGDILVDGEGMTLYVFDNDTDENSTCYDDCEANWPPLTEEVEAGDGVDESLLSTSEREDGTQQVTYAGKPLYYFAGDQAAGDTNGQGVGDIWWVVGPDGEAITGAGGGGGGASDDSDGGAASNDDDGDGY
jgi:predicted lipoprotein with Yx(FWY)xxD motif